VYRRLVAFDDSWQAARPARQTNSPSQPSVRVHGVTVRLLVVADGT
jgi:hypothetical protein